MKGVLVNKFEGYLKTILSSLLELLIQYFYHNELILTLSPFFIFLSFMIFIFIQAGLLLLSQPQTKKIPVKLLMVNVHSLRF